MLGANHIPETSDMFFNTTSNNTLEPSFQEEFVCAFYNPDFIIYSSLGSFYIPCFVMIFLYGRIFRVSNVKIQLKMYEIKKFIKHPIFTKYHNWIKLSH